MMDAAPGSPLGCTQAYRTARRAFIAACEAAGVDTVARLDPAKAADGKPLFMDAAALGPRLAQRAVVAVARDSAGSAIQIGLLKTRLGLPERARLVLVHAYDPASFAGITGNPDWPAAMLGAVATEDLSRVSQLGVLPLAMAGDGLVAPLAAKRPTAAIILLPRADDSVVAKAAIENFLAQ